MSSPVPDQSDPWRFLVDENMPRPLAPALRTAGYFAEDVRDVGLRSHPDSEIWTYAQAQRETLITFDAGFGDIRAYPSSHAGVVIASQFDKITPATQIRLILEGLASLQGQSMTDAIVTISPGRVRVRRS